MHNFSALFQNRSAHKEKPHNHMNDVERRLCAERKLNFSSHLLMKYLPQVLIHSVPHFILNVVRSKYRCTVWGLIELVYFRRQHQCEQQPCCALLWQTMSRLVHRMAPPYNPSNIAELNSHRHFAKDSQVNIYMPVGVLLDCLRPLHMHSFFSILWQTD